MEGPDRYLLELKHCNAFTWLADRIIVLGMRCPGAPNYVQIRCAVLHTLDANLVTPMHWSTVHLRHYVKDTMVYCCKQAGGVYSKSCWILVECISLTIKYNRFIWPLSVLQCLSRMDAQGCTDTKTFKWMCFKKSKSVFLFFLIVTWEGV